MAMCSWCRLGVAILESMFIEKVFLGGKSPCIGMLVGVASTCTLSCRCGFYLYVV